MDKYKKLLGNTVVFAIGQFGAKLLSFFLVRLYTATLTTAEYSTADLLYQTLNVLVPIVTFAMSDAIIRFGLDNAYDKRKVYTSAVLLTTLGMLVFALTTPIWNATSFYHGYTFLLYGYCYFSVFRSLASQFTRAKGMVKLFAIDGIFATLTQFVCNLIFMLWLDMGITGYILSFIVSDLISLILLTVFAQLYKCLDTKFISRKLIREMLKYSAPLIPTYLLWWITSASDRVFVIKMVGESDNGIYSVAYKLPTLLMLVTTMFYQAWQMSSIEEKDSAELGKFFRSVFSVYSSLMYVAAAGLIMISKPMTDILTSGDSYNGAEKYTVILIIAMVFQCFCQFLSSIYSVKKKSANSCYTALSAAVVNIVLNFLLIPHFRVYGAAIATAAAYGTCFVIRIFDARKFIRFRVDHLRLILNTAFVIAMSVISITEPKLYVLWIILCFAAVAVLNFGALKLTVKKLFGRFFRKTA